MAELINNQARLRARLPARFGVGILNYIYIKMLHYIITVTLQLH